jgi:hypothetical protein
MREPPGGPPDSTPPHIVVVRPESGAVVHSFSGDAVIDFDEVIDEMAGGAASTGGAGGVTGIGRQVALSPVNGDVRVSWHRKSIHVKPAEGWKPDRVYQLQVLPGILDLRHNIMKKGQTVVFSTGPAIPHAVLSGVALQWIEQRALAKAVIRAALVPDTVPYVAVADSGGAFSLAQIPPGTYHLSAIQDQNGNRRLDPREAFDSVTVTVDTTSPTVILWAFVHDTTAPRLRQAEPVDSLAFRLTFSEPLAPQHLPDTTGVRLFALPDTSPVALEGVWTSSAYDSLQARAQTLVDSLRRARDTTVHAKDTAAVSRRAHASTPRPAAPARADTGRIVQLLRHRPVPTDRFVARATKPLTPGAKYLVRVRGALNLSGRLGDGQQVFEVPARKPPPDSTRAKPAPRHG